MAARPVPGESPIRRRRALAALAALAAGPLAFDGQAGVLPDHAAAPSPGATRFAAAWQAGSGYRVGLLQRGARGLAAAAAVEVPTRAHGLWAEADGRHFLAVARRPGDWLLRWDTDGRAVAWAWNDPDRAFNGHVIASPDGKRLYTTETDLETGGGLVGVRDAASLEKQDEWPTAGMDPHELTWDAAGRLIVANGGIPTLPETGRLKIDLDRMDASLVRLDPRDGRLDGQWRLEDPRLSLRHLAWHGDVLGLALQAEHDDPARKAVAPVFARFDGRRLMPAPAPAALAGYGGDVAAAAGLFAVSCPRANRVALWQADGRWWGDVPLEEACPLAADGPRLWAGGLHGALALPAGGTADVGALRLDNHWLALG